jgi:predicted O-methyltransferase YrrM
MTGLVNPDSLRDTRDGVPWRQVTAPADVLATPSMLSAAELSLLYSLTRVYCSGAGRIADAGCFLGGSTRALASGLRDRADAVSAETVVSYDRFRVEPYTLAGFSDVLNGARAGESFRAVFDSNLRGLEERVDVREGDVCRIGWDGRPIEVLFIDILKSWKINDTFLSQFFGCLIPGRSIVVQQDYAHGFCPWIHITMELLADYFAWIDYVPHASYVYLLEREIPDYLLQLRPRTDLSTAEKRELMERAVARADGEVRALLELAQSMLLLEVGPSAQARALHRRVKRDFPQFASVQACAEAAQPWMRRPHRVRLAASAGALLDKWKTRWKGRPPVQRPAASAPPL